MTIFYRFFSLFLFVLASTLSFAQTVPIQDYSVNGYGQVQLAIEAQADKYYLLHTTHEPNNGYQSTTSMTMGVDGTLLISEPAAAYDLQNYSITAHDIANPDDTDGDGIDDIAEFNNIPTWAPLNYGNEVPFEDGGLALNSHEEFESFATIEASVGWAPFLNNRQFVKFAILNQNTDEAEIYFINSATHFVHQSFLNTIDTDGADIVKGEIVYNPQEILPNGVIGSYYFNYSFGSAYSFETTQRTFELLVTNMPFLQNNMSHFIGSQGEGNYTNTYQPDYEGSRINVILESEFFSDIDFIPFNNAEGYGYFRHMTLDESPGSRDIVLYDVLPNSLPRVGGIMTSIIQTPLSHVNLRAIQDNVPNAYIKNPLEIDSIASLLNSYIYYKVEEDHYYIRSATQEEVNAWFENIRPTEEQIPDRDLSITQIMPLDSITFDMSTSFGAKCSNVATMRTFGFPEGTIPNGFGVPFYFYDEFMKYNNFYEQAENMINDPDFISDLDTRIDMLKDFRKDIKNADMPQWMLDELEEMHESFPEGTSVRCRSSTNNEDLPGFSGAGLYTSKTQHPHEGHMSKSIKQVYASMWNFRAFDERDFYRVDHFVAAMGVLCHPNFEDEKSNGVGVSIDPIYQTAQTFYINTQVGESLITNPDANSIPEEILLHQNPEQGFIVLRESNLVEPDELVMEEHFLDSLRNYLQVIHDEFEILYDIVGVEGFAMDIEYKVTAQDQLVIKQARPWVSFWADINATYDLEATELINPQNAASLSNNELVSVTVTNKGLKRMSNFDLSLLVDDQFVETLFIPDTLSTLATKEYEFTVPQDFSTIGDYDITAIVSHTQDGYNRNDTLMVVLSKLHLLESGITLKDAYTQCNGDIEVKAIISNYGETTLLTSAIEVIANGTIVDTVYHSINTPYQSQSEVTILISENIQASDNEITLNLLRVNSQQDADISNNSITIYPEAESTHDYITLVINPDNYPQEISWKLVDELSNTVVATGELDYNQSTYTHDICVDYSSCFTLTMYDSASDGICCAYGQGNFLMLNTTGDTIFTNDGQYLSSETEFFCPNGEGCTITANINITDVSEEEATDGAITIIPTTGFGPYEYSIDGGTTFTTSNTFDDLAIGDYNIVINDAYGTCTYEETVTIEEEELVGSHHNIETNEFKVYPNPTEGDITIEFNEKTMSTAPYTIEIYDYLGRLIETKTHSTNTANSRVEISLQNYGAGTYFGKCYNNTTESYFKVIKL